jgi:hypothetical protein
MARKPAATNDSVVSHVGTCPPGIKSCFLQACSAGFTYCLIFGTGNRPGRVGSFIPKNSAEQLLYLTICIERINQLVNKILAYLDDNATSAATALLPDCRATPTVGLFV